MEEALTETRVVFDASVLENISGGDHEFEQELIEVFKDTSPTILADYRAARQIADQSETIRNIHSLKGSARQMGLNVLGEICAELENYHRGDCLTDPPVTDEDLDATYTDAIAALDRYVREL